MFWLARYARAQTPTRSIGFCAIWVGMGEYSFEFEFGGCYDQRLEIARPLGLAESHSANVKGGCFKAERHLATPKEYAKQETHDKQ